MPFGYRNPSDCYCESELAARGPQAETEVGLPRTRPACT